mgnify:CR=1 FL=1
MSTLPNYVMIAHKKIKISGMCILHGGVWYTVILNVVHICTWKRTHITRFNVGKIMLN